MSENKFCYSKMIDINLEEKANISLNNDCQGCIYFDFCLKDKVKDVEKAEKETIKNTVNNKNDSDVSAVSNNGEDTNKIVASDNKPKDKVKPKVTKTKSKKASLEELVDDDIF